MHKIWPKAWLPELYQLNSKLWLSFLAKVETSPQPYFDPTRANAYVRRLEADWINWDIKLQKDSKPDRV